MAATDTLVEELATKLAPRLKDGVGEHVIAQLRELGIDPDKVVMDAEAAHEQTREHVKTVLQEWGLVDENGKPNRPPDDPTLQALAHGDRIKALLDYTKPNPGAVGAQLNGKFQTFGDFLRSVVRSSRGRPDDRIVLISEDGEADIRADLSGDDVASGGALVPEEFRATLLEIGQPAAQIRPRAFNVPMGSSSIKLPAIRETSRASSVHGGVIAYWTKPGGTITESEPAFQLIQLDAHGLKLLTETPNELLSDSFMSVEALIARMYGDAVVYFEENAFIRGDGAGEPSGVVTADCGVDVDRATSSEVNWTDLVNMYARMLPGSLGRAVWMANIDVFPQLAQMALSVGTGGSAIWINNGVEGPPARILGRPVLFNEHCTTMGTIGDIMFVDWGYYLIGDRQALSLATSGHAGFETNTTKFRGVERLDGRPWLESALTPAQGSNSLSPIVRLAT